jgi:hypothetical protein
MAAEISGPRPESAWSTIISSENETTDQVLQAIRARVGLPAGDHWIAEMRQGLMTSVDMVVDGAQVQSRLLSVGISKAANRLTEEVCDGKTSFGEMIEIARYLALIGADDEFEKRLTATADTLNDLRPGTYVYPGNTSETLWLEGEADVRGIAPGVDTYPRVGRIKSDSEGQSSVWPQVETLTDEQGVDRVGIALHVAVELGDDTETETVVRPYGHDKSLVGDLDTIAPVLKEQIREAIAEGNPLSVQALAEDFGLLGAARAKDRLHQRASQMAENSLVNLLNSAGSVGEYIYSLNAMRYLMIHNPELMEETYDRCAHEYAVYGGLMGTDVLTNRAAQRFFCGYTRAADWIAEGSGKVATPMLADAEAPSDALLELKASQAFLERGRELLEVQEAEELKATKAMFPHLFPETDPS